MSIELDKESQRTEAEMTPIQTHQESSRNPKCRRYSFTKPTQE